MLNQSIYSIGAVKESLILKFEECHDKKEMLSRGVTKSFYKSNYNIILSQKEEAAVKGVDSLKISQ